MNTILEARLREARAAFGNVRPIHKQNLANARLNAEQNKKHPEPMSLFRKREKELDRQFSSVVNGERVELPRIKPEVSKGDVEKAADAAASWDLNDPFAYGRTALHVKQGYLRSDEVVKEFSMRTIARKAAKVKEIDDAKRA